MYQDTIKTYDNVLPAEFCEKLINIYETHPGKVQGVCGKGKVDKTLKNCVDLFISAQEDLLECDMQIKEYLTPYVHQYINNIEEQARTLRSGFVPFDTYGLEDDGYNMKKYTVSESSFFGWHHDTSIKQSGLARLFGIILYLNDVREGGCTEFIDGTKIHPVQGRLLIFPSTWTFVHRGAPPKSNEKYIITSFLMGYHFGGPW